MERIPKGWMFTLGLSVLAVVAALVASSIGPRSLASSTHAVGAAEEDASAQADSCLRYGKVECCVRGE